MLFLKFDSDMWYKRVIKINDCLCWNVYKFFR